MVFHSLRYAVFLTIVFLVYWNLGYKRQNRFLLLASYIFYASWDWRFLSLILITTTTDFFCGNRIHLTQDTISRKRWVKLSVGVNLGILAIFKYFNFFTENLIHLLGFLGLEVMAPSVHIILPVGISFFTFQSMSFTLDVYRKQVEPATNFLDYALYVAFFPQLVAGPIERGKNLLPQVLSPRGITVERIHDAVFLFLLGVFKKVFVADNLGELVDPIFAQNGGGSGSLVLLAGYAFLFQIYCDFSAYTDMARASAKLLGFEIMENFRAPYFAKNLQDFWNRWHISLTTWIRDYLYYPLAFKRWRKRSLPPALVTVITFLIMGLWHGAAWGYVLWGGYNGVILAGYAAFSTQLRKRKIKAPSGWKPYLNIVSIVLTFHLILIGDIFFRSHSLGQAGTMLHDLFFAFSWLPQSTIALQDLVFYSAPILFLDVLLLFSAKEGRLTRYPRVVRYALYYLMLGLVIKFGAPEPSFIYFQF